MHQNALDMIREVSNNEVKDAMLSIDDNKASGPDRKGKLLGELNVTLITLVPKVSTPTKVTDFRPIACCNVAYKCISKIIINRIKNVLDSIVDTNQSAFITERQIIVLLT
ncbi:RNA-directed DNA polymerase, eukaryota, reverse transcriptase zinc-binding domain protein [Tanacetum coccineum]|uniref:RNA-directed DNA polymerase, eukaryota, reverse transcriptase zinc-binding domain protein n=1 Tax=Tanacetum coccineum TaxID=301880 RepID=A0ABQ4WQP6_9ASTR